MKIGQICTPYREIFEIAREKKRMSLENINIIQHGTVEGYITDDKMILRIRITDSNNLSVSCSMLLDTGSNITVISSSIADLFHKSEGILIKGVHTAGLSSMITGRLCIEDKIMIDTYEIYTMDLDAFDESSFDGIIGMDLIQAGSLRIFRKDGLPYFEFTL